MSYKVISIPKFERELKRLVKKYPSLKAEYFDLVQSLKLQPDQGTSVGNDCYKIRIAIASKGKGKSGGARVVTYVQVMNTEVYFLTIYDKNEKDSISDRELVDLLKWIQE